MLSLVLLSTTSKFPLPRPLHHLFAIAKEARASDGTLPVFAGLGR